MYDGFLALMEQKQRFLISGHVHPDGDCLGTQAALYHFLVQAGKDAWIVNEHPPEPVFDFLQKHTPFDTHIEGRGLPDHEVHVLTDCSTLDRLGAVGREAGKLEGKTRVVVDHHVGGDLGVGDVLLWDVHAASSGALIYDLFRKAGAPMTKPAAEGIFVSIVSDTGWFRFANTTDDALAICADLVVHGVRPHLIYNAMHRRKPQTFVSLLSEGLAKTTFAAGGKIGVIALRLDFVRRAAAADFNTDELLDPPRSVDGVDVVVLLKERDNGTVKISLRSSDRVDVDSFARSLGGGGHRKAAGAEVSGNFDGVTGRVLQDLEALVGS